jgi:hypothetical protein
MSSYITNIFIQFQNYFRTQPSKIYCIDGNVELPRGNKNTSFIIDRYLTPDIRIGICNKNCELLDNEFKKIKNTYQGLMYNNQYYNLYQIKNEDKKIIYNFRGLNNTDNLTLEISAKNPSIHYSLYNYNYLFDSGYIDKNIINTFKIISVNSDEIDMLKDFFKKSE